MEQLKLKVKTETLADRCEVCHQNDLFEPATNYCQRCGNTSALIKPENQNLNSNILESKWEIQTRLKVPKIKIAAIIAYFAFIGALFYLDTNMQIYSAIVPPVSIIFLVWLFNI